VQLLSSHGLTVSDVTEYGTGFEVCEDKRQLVRVPFIVLDWRFSEGDHGRFVSMTVVTRDGRKLIINDGSTGIRQQMEKITEDRLKRFEGDLTKAHAGLAVPKGLRVSEYVYVDRETGKAKDATTYYLNY